MKSTHFLFVLFLSIFIFFSNYTDIYLQILRRSFCRETKYSILKQNFDNAKYSKSSTILCITHIEKKINNYSSKMIHIINKEHNHCKRIIKKSHTYIEKIATKYQAPNFPSGILHFPSNQT